jgi:hypothetical protein
MAVYNDEINARYNLLLGNVSGLETAIKQTAELQKLLNSLGIDLPKEGLAKNINTFLGLDKIKLPKQKMPTTDQLFKGLTESFSDSTTGRMDAFAQKLAMLESKGMDVSSAYKGVAEIYGENSVQMTQFGKSMDEARKKMTMMYRQSKQMQMMGKMFGFLFGGMMMQRWGQSILRFVLPSMEKLENHTSDGTKRINAMNASFQFLKFSMFEMITSSRLFIIITDAIIKLTNWFSQLVSQNKGVQILVGTVAALGALFVIGGVFGQILGGYYQAGMLWTALFGKSSASAAAKDVDTLKGKFEGLHGVLDKIGLGLSIGVAAFSLADMVFNIKKEDFAGALGSGVAAALGISGAVAFLMGAGPVGWVLTITGAVVLAVTKITADARRANVAAKDVLGFDKNIFVDYVDGLFGKQEGMIGVATSKALSDYSKTFSEVARLESLLSQTDKGDASKRISLNNALNEEKSKLTDLTRNLYDMDAQNAPYMIEQLEFQINAYNEAANSVSKITEEYNPLLTTVAATKEETDLFNKNMKLLLDTFNSDMMAKAISNLQLIDSTWVDATTHLGEFATKLDEWASKVVTKTVQIEYKESNRPSGTGGFLDTVGSAVKTFVGGITGTRP